MWFYVLRNLSVSRRLPCVQIFAFMDESITSHGLFSSRNFTTLKIPFLT